MKYELPKSTLELIEQSFPGISLKIFLDDDWSSQVNEFRVRLRESLASTLSEQVPNEETDKHLNKILDLTRLPKLGDLKVSISHTQGLGGWIQAQTSSELGFDIELSSRVSLEPVQRISTPQELASAPAPTYIWTAKEASFKALAHTHKLRVMSQVETQNWIPLQNYWWMFKPVCGGKTLGSGLSGPHRDFHLSIVKTSTGFT